MAEHSDEEFDAKVEKVLTFFDKLWQVIKVGFVIWLLLKINAIFNGEY